MSAAGAQPLPTTGHFLQAYVHAVVLLQTLRFEGARLGFKQLIKVWGLHTLQLILAELQPHILKPLFHDISNYFRDFLQFFQSLQSQIGGTPISNLPPSQDLLFSFCLSLLALGHSLCSTCICRIHTCVLLNSFHQWCEAQCFIK